MGVCIREHDWSATPLGPPDSWPASLRTAVRLLLATRHPTAIGWGPSLLQLHNDAFACVIGADGRPRVAGAMLRELCADLWPRLGPLTDGALHRGEPAAIEDQLFCIYRDGYAEERYLTCACSPLADDRGRTGGVMITIADSTEHVVGTRRTAALEDVAAGSAGAHSVDETCQRALAAVARHPSDVPFALLYLCDAEDPHARLAATAGIVLGTAASPESIELEPAPDASMWPLREALRTNETVVVDDLLTRFGTLPAGDWPFAPRSAVVLPLTSPGRDEPDAVFVAGVSARHALDVPYRGFIELMGKHIAAAIAGGRVHEDDERHAAARVAAKQARARRRARLRALKAKFAGALEERTRLAREIHDTILQGVTGIALQLRAVHPHVRTSPDSAAETLRRIVELAEKTSRDARQAVWDIRPAALTERDFVRAIEGTARRLVAGTTVGVTLSATGRPRRLADLRQVELLRIAQEAIANVVRHAEARRIRLYLAFGERRLRLIIADDGRGFVVQPDFRSYAGHWGLLGMQERARNLGGTVTVRSAPGGGTTVRILLPYRAGDDSAVPDGGRPRLRRKCG